MPEIDLEWITEDNRQNHYIQTLIFLLTNHTLYDEGNITCREKTIGKKHPEIASQHYPPKTKNELLIVLDFSIATHPEKIILIESVKKRWSQNKYRANQNGKNQYNFILSDKAIYRLDKLAKKHEIKRTEVLPEFIE